MALTKERKGEVAYLALKEMLKQRGFRVVSKNEYQRQLGNTAKVVGVSKEEFEEFSRELSRELFEEMVD